MRNTLRRDSDAGAYLKAALRTARFHVQDALGLLKPRKLRIGLTNRCNAKCIMCNIWKMVDNTAPSLPEELRVEEIDRINILQASLLAMQRAVAGLVHAPALVLVDGNRAPVFACPARAVVGGDALEPSISAASILAKVARDRTLIDLHQAYPHYGFDRHKGYPTADHLAALAEHGPCPEHRRSFAPVRRACSE